MTKLIVVLGATGNQGGSVAAKFLQEPGWKVRAVTRDSSSEKAKKLEAQGVEVVEGDLDKPETIEKAFSGANAIFAVTDFWMPFFKAYPELSQKGPRATGEYAKKLELQRGKVFVDAAAKILREEQKLELLIWSTLPAVKERSGGKYTFAYHFEGKAEIAKYIETAHPDLHAKTSLLYVGLYATNDVDFELFRGSLKKEADGTYSWDRVGPLDAQQFFVDPRDTGLFALLLTRKGPGIKLLGVGEKMSYREYTKIWEDRLGIRINLKELSVAQVDANVPGGLGREIAESVVFGVEFGWGDDLVTPKDLDPAAPVTTMKQYIEGENRYTVLFPDLK